jgi:hypothetical protein
MLFRIIPDDIAPILATMDFRPYVLEGKTLPDGRIILDNNDLNNIVFAPVLPILNGMDTVDIDPADISDEGTI